MEFPPPLPFALCHLSLLPAAAVLSPLETSAFLTYKLDDVALYSMEIINESLKKSYLLFLTAFYAETYQLFHSHNKLLPSSLFLEFSYV